MALASAQIALTALSTASQYQAAKAKGNYQKGVADINARFADIQADDAILRGDRAAAKMKLKTKGVIGSQRAALAAQGIEVNDGSALDVQADTAGQGAMDALTIKNNSWREAFGYKAQARGFRTSGDLAKLASKNEARSTLLTGGLQAVQAGVGGFDRFQKSKGTKTQWY